MPDPATPRPARPDRLFRKKPVVIEAHEWRQNGDHPDDFSDRARPDLSWVEGMVVRYFRRPDVSGDSLCSECGVRFHDHGWIDTLEDGHRVCPGDFIITGVKGERYPCKPDIFAATYESASLAPSSPGAPEVSEEAITAAVRSVTSRLDRTIVKMMDDDELRRRFPEYHNAVRAGIALAATPPAGTGGERDKALIALKKVSEFHDTAVRDLANAMNELVDFRASLGTGKAVKATVNLTYATGDSPQNLLAAAARIINDEMERMDVDNFTMQVKYRNYKRVRDALYAAEPHPTTEREQGQ